MDPKEIINQFYNAFAQGNAKAMNKHYAEKVCFKDPAFGSLKNERVKFMWLMLLSQKRDDTSITYEIIEVSENTAIVKWVAKYQFGPKERKVINHVTSELCLENQKIVEHYDDFNLWRWTRQALGIPGLLFGWSSFMRQKIQKQLNKRLDRFIEKQH